MNYKVDAHIHITENGDYHGLGIDCSVEKLLRQMDESGYDKGVLIAVPNMNTNAEISRICKKYPDKFIGFGNVDPNNKNFEDEIERLKFEHNLNGIKLHGRMGKFSYLHENILPICKKAGKLDLPVEFCLWPAFPGPLSEMSPYTIEKYIMKCPETNFIIGHVGGFKMWEAFMLCKAYPNVYLDFTYTINYFENTSYFQDIIFMLKKANPKRCMIGSDFPENNLSDIKRISEKALKDFSIAERAEIQGNTILNLTNNN